MPYIKTPAKPSERVTRLLKGYGLNGNKLSEILGCAPATALSKLADPQRFTLGDLMAVNKKAHIPVEEIREAIFKE